MTGLLGVFGPPTDTDGLRSIATRMAESQNGTKHDIRFGARGFVGVGSGVATAEIHAHDGVTVAVCGMPRTREGEGAQPPGTAEIIRRFVGEYRKNGATALASLSGAFSLALVDERDGTLLLAIDRLGIEQLFYAPVTNGVAFASTTDPLARHPQVAPRISPQALFDYIYFHEIPSPVTIYQGMTRLQPGEYVCWKRQKLETGKHARIEFDESRSAPFATLKDEFVAALRDRS